MPELPIVEPSADAAELAVLKQAHQEILTKRQKDKARIAELEAGAVTLQSQLTEASESLHEVTVGGPLKAMAESLSTVPDLFLEQFSKHFKLLMVKGTLTLFSSDGKPVTSEDGKAIPFEWKAIAELLTTGDDARARTFKAITIASRASGGASIGTNNRVNQAKAARPQFGLR